VSFGGEVRKNQGTASQSGETDYGVIFTMTLKDAPQVTLPLAFDQATSPLGGDSSQ
jgi:hypothetical protein